MKTLLSILFASLVAISITKAQDTIYVYQAGAVVYKNAVASVDSISFTYKAPINGTVSDNDGHSYTYIKIGTQTWMTENLKTSKYRNGESISNITDGSLWGSTNFGAWCDYDNINSNGINYGHLYNWSAVNDNRGLAPDGWHVATDAEWTTLMNYLILNGYNYDKSTTGNKISKSIASKSVWTTSSVTGSIGNNLTLNNSAGLNIFPTGYRGTDGSFYLLGNGCDIWTATEGSTTTSYMKALGYNNPILETNILNKNYGFSVRCIKN